MNQRGLLLTDDRLNVLRTAGGEVGERRDR